jgi:3'-phosphoadenosine 5'-phosphosulfate sulfotransferase
MRVRLRRLGSLTGVQGARRYSEVTPIAYEDLKPGRRVMILYGQKGARAGAVGIIVIQSSFREVITVLVRGRRFAYLPDEIELLQD